MKNIRRLTVRENSIEESNRLMLEIHNTFEYLKAQGYRHIIAKDTLQHKTFKGYNRKGAYFIEWTD